jgi:hypothetical protein
MITERNSRKFRNENFGIKEIVAVKGINLLKLNLM